MATAAGDVGDLTTKRSTVHGIGKVVTGLADREFIAFSAHTVMIRQVVQLRHFQYPAGGIDGHVRPARRPRWACVRVAATIRGNGTAPDAAGLTGRVVIAGQGYVGLPIAMRAVEVGYDVVGYEPDLTRAKRLVSGSSYIGDVSDDVLAAALASGRYVPSDAVQACEGFDVAVITVPTPLTEGAPDCGRWQGEDRGSAGLHVRDLGESSPQTGARRTLPSISVHLPQDTSKALLF